MGQTDPLDYILSCSSQVIHKRPMSCTWHLENPNQTAFVKLVSTSSHPNITPGRLDAQIKQYLRSSVALSTYEVSQRMIDSGLRVPQVLFAAQRRQNWHCEDLLITKAVHGPSLWDVLINGNNRKETFKTFRMVGQRIAQLHQNGFLHGHMLPGHIIITPNGADAWFLDNDETRWRSMGVRQVDRRYNLTQVVSRISSGHFPNAPGAIRYLMDGYFDAAGLTERSRRQWRYRILSIARQRAQKRRHRQTFHPTKPAVAALTNV